MPATPTGTPSNSPSPTTYMTALAAPPLPGVITTVTLSNTFYFRTLPNLGSMFFMVTVSACDKFNLGSVFFTITVSACDNFITASTSFTSC